ncbi:hypothetical protein ACFQY0_00345 [Haloferula chungangensis]|uniref:Uncharacterized protein n=1 Tax=Haloferula chungangensis TaxID=1048331 RepID=A0ABW2L2N3_9BACT
MLQRFIRITFNPSWTLRRTLLSSGIFLTLTAAAVAMTGIIHELAWLSRAPMITNRGKNVRRTEAINNGKQIYYAMIEMASEGLHPSSLEEIIEFLDYRGDMFTYLPSHASYAREPFLLLHPGKDITSMQPETPIIAALGVDGSRCILVLADGSVEVSRYKDIENLLPAK